MSETLLQAAVDTSSILAVMTRGQWRLMFLLTGSLVTAGVQLLVYLVAKHETELDWWRALGLAIPVTMITGTLARLGGPYGYATTLLVSLTAAWALTDWLYDLRLKKKIPVILITPVISLLGLRIAKHLTYLWVNSVDH